MAVSSCKIIYNKHNKRATAVAHGCHRIWSPGFGFGWIRVSVSRWQHPATGEMPNPWDIFELNCVFTALFTYRSLASGGLFEDLVFVSTPKTHTHILSLTHAHETGIICCPIKYATNFILSSIFAAHSTNFWRFRAQWKCEIFYGLPPKGNIKKGAAMMKPSWRKDRKYQSAWLLAELVLIAEFLICLQLSFHSVHILNPNISSPDFPLPQDELSFLLRQTHPFRVPRHRFPSFSSFFFFFLLQPVFQLGACRGSII